MALIDITVSDFLIIEPPLAGTQDTLPLAPIAARLLYSQKPLIPSDDEVKEPTPDPVQQEMTDKDFEVFYQQEEPEYASSTSHLPPHLTQTSSSQEEAHIPKGMGFEERAPNLMALLEAHAGSASPTVPMMPVLPRPPTLAPGCASSSDVAYKKRKMGQSDKGPEDAEEGEVTHSFQQPSTKEARTTKAQ